jgi:hypothetical protein
MIDDKKARPSSPVTEFRDLTYLYCDIHKMSYPKGAVCPACKAKAPPRPDDER